MNLMGDARGDYDTEGRGKHLMFKMKRMGTPRTVGDTNLIGLRLEGNELDENFIKLDEMPFVVGKMRYVEKMKGGMKLKSNTNFDFRLFDNDSRPGSTKEMTPREVI